MSRVVIALSMVVALVGALAAGRAGFGTSAQEGETLDGHPLVGTWLAMTPFGAAAETFAADGSFVAGYLPTEAGASGVTLLSPGVGVWESTGPRSGRFTAVQAIS